MRIPTSLRAMLLASLLIGATLVDPTGAGAGSWSPRSGTQPALITNARLVRASAARTEIKPITPARHQARPPVATAKTPPGTTHSLLSERSTGRQSPPRDRAHSTRAALARLRPTGMPDRRAGTATLAALAGIFYEAHAPPFTPTSTL